MLQVKLEIYFLTIRMSSCDMFGVFLVGVWTSLARTGKLFIYLVLNVSACLEQAGCVNTVAVFARDPAVHLVTRLNICLGQSNNHIRIPNCQIQHFERSKPFAGPVAPNKSIRQTNKFTRRCPPLNLSDKQINCKVFSPALPVDLPPAIGCWP